jgi:hypothetical protein
MMDPLVAYTAGVLSTFPPHDREHPLECVPMAEAVLEALDDVAAFADWAHASAYKSGSK